MNTSLRFLAAIAFASPSFLCINAVYAETPIHRISIDSNADITGIETSIEPTDLPQGELVSVPEIALDEAIAPEEQLGNTDEPSERIVIRSRIFDIPSMCQ